MNIIENFFPENGGKLESLCLSQTNQIFSPWVFSPYNYGNDKTGIQWEKNKELIQIKQHQSLGFMRYITINGLWHGYLLLCSCSWNSMKETKKLTIKALQNVAKVTNFFTAFLCFTKIVFWGTTYFLCAPL